jgi:hypothetical protein
MAPLEYTLTTTLPAGSSTKPAGTYLVRAGEYEAIHGNMPPFGLGKAGRLVPLVDAKTARDW